MKKIPTVLFLYAGDDWAEPAPFVSAAIEDKSYREFFTRAKQERQIPMVRACIDWFQDGAWQKYWTFDGTDWVKHNEVIRPDIVIDKSSFQPEKFKQYQLMQQQTIFLNPWEIKTITSDKMISTVVLGDYSPKTFIVHTTAQLMRAIDAVQTQEVVVKPQYGFGGNGVQILPREEAKQLQITASHVVQECIDTSRGIRGIYEGYHDFRVVLMGNEPIFSYIRTAAPGTKLCNLTQGGDPICVPLSDIPPAALKVVEDIRKRFSGFPHSIYCIDFLFDENQKPWVVELTNSPGIFYPTELAEYKKLALDAYFSYCISLMSQ